MRGMFGFVSLLVGALIIAYIWAVDTKTVSTVNKQVQPQVQKMAGKNFDGTSALHSIVLAPFPPNGTMKGATVTSIDPASSILEYWGLLPGDVILTIGEFQVGDSIISDLDTAREWVVEGMQRQKIMTVDRGGTKITLPAERNTVAPIPGSGSVPVTPGQ